MQRRALLPLFLVAVLLQGTAAAPVSLASAVDCPLFPADSHWHTPVTDLPVAGRSGDWVGSIGSEQTLHPDFGAGTYDGAPIGIPFTTVPGDQAEVEVTFDFDDESDPSPYPIPRDAPVEGGPDSDGDRHVLIIDRDACVLHELFAAYPQDDGSWQAGSGARWDLRSHALRPDGWTSADAAGLPILPGLVRYDEVAAGRIDHAIRMTAPRTDRSYVWPARHQAGAADDPTLPPMGARFRLREDFDTSGFGPQSRVVLEALKEYGAILADNGSAWFLSGVPDERWDNDDLADLKSVPGAAFEAVDAASWQVDPDSGQASPDEAAPLPERLAGPDRVATAVAVSTRAYPDGAPTVVLASSGDFPDALAAAPLAAALGGPVLLTGETLAPAVRTELGRLSAERVLLVGGEAALPRAVADEVRDLGVTVERVAGQGRIETAVEAARAAVAAGADPTSALVASAANWPDALAAGALAARTGSVVLLSAPDDVPPAVDEFLAELDPDEVLLAGGPAAIDESVRQHLGARRIAGPDRIGTAIALADESEQRSGTPTRVLVATAGNWPDALAAGAATAPLDAALLLSAPDTLSDDVRAWVEERAPVPGAVLGGPAVISEPVRAAFGRAAA